MVTSPVFLVGGIGSAEPERGPFPPVAQAVLGSALTYQENVIVQDARWDDARQLLRLLDATSR